MLKLKWSAAAPGDAAAEWTAGPSERGADAESVVGAAQAQRDVEPPDAEPPPDAAAVEVPVLRVWLRESQAVSAPVSAPIQLRAQLQPVPRPEQVPVSRARPAWARRCGAKSALRV